MAAKRKGPSGYTAVASTAVVTGPSSIQARLMALRNEYRQPDALLPRLPTKHADAFTTIAVQSTAASMEQRLQHQIARLSAVVEQESETLYRHQVQLARSEAERDSLLMDLEAADGDVHELREQVALTQETVEEQEALVERLLQEQASTVMKLKHQISLYANVSGIHFEYEAWPKLEGEMVRVRTCVAYLACLVF